MLRMSVRYLWLYLPVVVGVVKPHGTDQWEMAGHGISLSAKGEPKSGNTWLGRLIPQLALELCGSRTNKW